MEYVENYQSVLHFQHSHIMLSNELLLIHAHQDLLYKFHPLFEINYFLNKHLIILRDVVRGEGGWGAKRSKAVFQILTICFAFIVAL